MAETTVPLRAAISVRLSRDADDSTSIATQEADCRALCELRGWTVVLVAVDDGVSGAVRPSEREGFGEILDRLDEIDVVVARSVDRFTRVTAHFAELVELLADGGATLADTQGQCDLTSPYGRFVTTIMVAFAEMERETIRARILRSRVELRQGGRWLGGAAPYGFVVVPDGEGGKRLDLDLEAAEVLREVVARFISGVTLSQEVERLNNSWHLSPADYRGEKAGRWHPPMARSLWTYSALHEHLRSEVLRGYRVEGKRETRRAVRDADGEPVRVGPALLDDNTWHALQARLDEAGSTPRRPRRKATLLLHVAQCQDCVEDPTLYYNAREYKSGRMDVYSCAASRLKRVRETGPCPGTVANAEKVEALVEDWFLRQFGPAEFTRRVRVGGTDHAAELSELEADVEELSGRLAGLRGPALDAVLGQLQGRSDRLEELRAAPVEEARWEWEPTGRTVADEWHAKEGDVAARRLMLLEYGVRVTVAPAYGRRTWDPSRVSIDLDEDTRLRWEMDSIDADATD